MGNEQASLPVPRQPPHSMFCISLRPHRKIELVHAPPKVAMIVQKVANEVNSLYTGQHMETPTKDKLGVLQFTMAADLFVTASGKEPATMGKLFCISSFLQKGGGRTTAVQSDMCGCRQGGPNHL